jgi:phosphate transport system permease protein
MVDRPVLPGLDPGHAAGQGLRRAQHQPVHANTPAPGSEGGGLRNAIVGSLMMVGLSTAISTPIGILAGIYLAEYGETTSSPQVTRFVTDIMLSAPSIVIGLFVYALYVATARHFSGYAGTIALSLIAVPVVVRTTDNMLRLVPNSLLEAAFALGAPRWKVAMMVRLRAVKAGVITGVLLAVARISGETAPLLFTALNNQFFSADMNAPMANLPVVIYQLRHEPVRQLARPGLGRRAAGDLQRAAPEYPVAHLFSQKTRIN